MRHNFRRGSISFQSEVSCDIAEMKRNAPADDLSPRPAQIRRIDAAAAAEPPRVWVQIAEAPGYAISDQGEVKNCTSGRLLALSGGTSYAFCINGKPLKRSRAKLMRIHHPGPSGDVVVWKTIEEFPGYELNHAGQVRNRASKFVLQTITHPSGYVYASFSSITRPLHQLMLQTFVGPGAAGCTPNHKNGVKGDNRLENLEWATPSQQSQHALSTGLASGTRNVAVIQLALDGTEIRVWKSFIEAAASVGGARNSVSKAAHNPDQPVYAGFRWKLAQQDVTQGDTLLVEESWKPVVSYEGLYEVSSHGRVRKTSTGRLVSPFFRGAYATVELAKRENGEKRCRTRKFSSHRLVAAAFVPNVNPAEQVVVDHIDGNKTNNHFTNLEWVTSAENVIRGRGRPVDQLDHQGNLVARFASINTAARTVLAVGNTKVYDQIAARCRHADERILHGFVWRYSAS